MCVLCLHLSSVCVSVGMCVRMFACEFTVLLCVQKCMFLSLCNCECSLVFVITVYCVCDYGVSCMLCIYVHA